MHRHRIPRILFSTLLLTVVCCGLLSAQDVNQMIPIASPPTRKIDPPSPTATLQDLEDGGDELRVEKAYLDAIDYYQAALKKQPTRHQASVICNKIGMAEVQMGHYDEAKHSFEKAAKLERTNANAINNIGSMYYQSKSYPRAIKYYRRALLLSPDTASFHANLGSAYMAHKNLEQADAEYLRALQLDPDVFEAHSTIGITALMKPEDRANYSYTLAKMYAKNGQFDRSLLYLRRAMEEGYKNIDHVYQDPEFAQLRKDQRFTALMAQPPVAIP